MGNMHGMLLVVRKVIRSITFDIHHCIIGINEITIDTVTHHVDRYQVGPNIMSDPQAETVSITIILFVQ